MQKESIHTPEPQSDPAQPKKRWHDVFTRIRTLEGDPHYVALGMAIGVFVGVTPTIPFHTVLAVAMALALRASKPAAAIGVWFANPITIPPLYIGCYKVGKLILGDTSSELTTVLTLMDTLESKIDFTDKLIALQQFLSHELQLAAAMLLGGMLLGIVPGVIAYFVTFRAFRAWRAKVAAEKDNAPTPEASSGNESPPKADGV